MTKNIILKVLVGSRAHGLANEQSDYDSRSVYVTSTKEIL
jgi:predicted nucleotidyltransferase